MKQPEIIGSTSRVRRRALAVVVILIILLTGWQASRVGHRPLPYDVTSTRPDGTKALSLLLEHFGAHVDRGSRPTGSTALLLSDTLDRRETSIVEDWVRDGGTLVVADPGSSFTPDVVADDGTASPSAISKQCDMADVHDVGSIAPGPSGSWTTYDVPAATSRCYPAFGGYFLAEGALGKGRVLALGGPGPFVNAQLDRDDNSVLAVRLLKPERGGSITVLEGQGAGVPGGSDSVASLVPAGASAGMWQLVVAAVVMIVWRWRRFGRLVEEPMPVELESARLTLAVGGLLLRSRKPSDAARMLRDDANRRLAQRLGLEVGAPVAALTEVLAQRFGLDEREVREALVERPIASADELLALARELESILMEVTRVR
jgi:hypothetical protein